MTRIVVRSKTGSALLVVIGGVYTVAATIVFAWFTIDVWGAAAMVDRVLQGSLLLCAAIGIWFLSVGLENLHITLRGRRLGLQGRRRVAAAQS